MMMDILIVIIFILSILLNLFLFWRGYKLVSIIEKYQIEIVDNFEAYYNNLQSLLENMRSIDTSGAFESDDEVGTIFTELKDLIEEYNNILDDKEEA